MFEKYTLNAQDAKGVGASPRITTSGAYVGAFIFAELTESRNGATMLKLHFKDENNQSANLSMCLFDREGKPTFQKPILDALMTVMKLREIAVQDLKVKDREGVERQAKAIPSMMNKPVGLILQNRPEEYPDRMTGEIKVGPRMHIRTPFEVGTNLNAKEILEHKTEAVAVQAILNSLHDAPVKKYVPKDNGFETVATTSSSVADDPFGDTMPF